MDEPALSVAVATLREIFRPSAPTQTADLFRGRRRELDSVIAGFSEAGQHVIVYGERGVGKTSLSYVASELFAAMAPGLTLVVRVQCADEDDFDSVWRSFYRELQVSTLLLPRELREQLEPALDRAEELLLYPDEDRLTAPVVSAALRGIASVCRFVVVIDEFDRLGGVSGTTGFSDLIKSLSDVDAPLSLLLVGVADDVSGLISGHLSVERNLRQVAMPMMTDSEISEIVTGGFSELQRRTNVLIEVDSDAAELIAEIAQGFPYYGHLLAGAAGVDAMRTGDMRITKVTVFRSMIRAVEDASHAIRTKYVDGTISRADSKIELTLLAAAMCVTDELGYFSSSDVAQNLSALMGVSRSAAHVNAHLARLSESPTWVLEQRKFSEKRVRYRFQDPLMRPFVLMKGYEKGQMPDSNKSP